MATKEKEKREKKKYQLKSHWVSKAAAAITSFCNHSLFNTPVFPQREETI
jgi:hypothetical protein